MGLPACSPAVPGQEIPVSSWANGTFLNNILHGTRYAIDDSGLKGEAIFDYNSLYKAGYRYLARLRGEVYAGLGSLQRAGHERHGVLGPSRFVDLPAGDLRLATGSIEIDRGVRRDAINDDFAGAAPDTGPSSGARTTADNNPAEFTAPYY